MQLWTRGTQPQAGKAAGIDRPEQPHGGHAGEGGMGGKRGR